MYSSGNGVYHCVEYTETIQKAVSLGHSTTKGRLIGPMFDLIFSKKNGIISYSNAHGVNKNQKRMICHVLMCYLCICYYCATIYTLICYYLYNNTLVCQ